VAAPSSPLAVDEKIDSVLVILTRQIGDVLLSTPLIHAARARWPKARIDVLGFAGTLAILRGNPDVNGFVEVKQGDGWRQSWPLIKWLWRRYDLALICEFSDRAHLYGWIAARLRAGKVFPRWSVSWWKRPLLKHAVHLEQSALHVVLEALRVIAPWARPSGPIQLVPPAERPLPEDVRARLRKHFVVLHAPTLVKYKQWPVEYYAALVRALAQRGLQSVLTGSGSESDRRCTADVVRAAALGSGDVLDLAGQLDFGQLSGLIQEAQLYVGPDTSITHLAAASTTPVVALFGPTDPMRWGPWSRGSIPIQPYVAHREVQHEGRITLMQGPQPCVPCRKAGCDNHDASRSECLKAITPQQVLVEVGRILGVPVGVPMESPVAAQEAYSNV
jgi:heptosyltransferase-3